MPGRHRLPVAAFADKPVLRAWNHKQQLSTDTSVSNQVPKRVTLTKVMAEKSRSVLDMRDFEQLSRHSSHTSLTEGSEHGDQEPNPLTPSPRYPGFSAEMLRKVESPSSGMGDIITAEASKEQSSHSKYVNTHYSKHLKQKYLEEQQAAAEKLADAEEGEQTDSTGASQVQSADTFASQSEDGCTSPEAGSSGASVEDHGLMMSGRENIITGSGIIDVVSRVEEVIAENIVGCEDEAQSRGPTFKYESESDCENSILTIASTSSGASSSAHTKQSVIATAHDVNESESGNEEIHLLRSDVSHENMSLQLSNNGSDQSCASTQPMTSSHLPKHDPYVKLTGIKHWMPNHRYLSQINLQTNSQPNIHKKDEGVDLQAKWMELKNSQSSRTSQSNALNGPEQSENQRRSYHNERYKHSSHKDYRTKTIDIVDPVKSDKTNATSQSKVYDKYSSIKPLTPVPKKNPSLFSKPSPGSPHRLSSSRPSSTPPTKTSRPASSPCQRASTSCSSPTKPRPSTSICKKETKTQQLRRPLSAKIEVHIPQDDECNALLLSSSDVSEFDDDSDVEEVAPEDDMHGELLLPGLDVVGNRCCLHAPDAPTSPRTTMRLQLRLELREFRQDFLDLYPRLAEVKRKMLALFNEFRDNLSCNLHQPVAMTNYFCYLIKSMGQYFTAANETTTVYREATENAKALEAYVEADILEQHRALLKANMKDNIRSVNRIVRTLTSMLPDRKSDYIINQESFVDQLVQEIHKHYDDKEEAEQKQQQQQVNKEAVVVHHSACLRAEDNPILTQQMLIAPAPVKHKKKEKYSHHHHHHHHHKHHKNKVSPSAKETKVSSSKEKSNPDTPEQQPSKPTLKAPTSGGSSTKKSKVLFEDTNVKKKLPKIFTKFKSPKGTVYREQVRGNDGASSPYSSGKTSSHDEEAKRKRADTDSTEKPVGKLRCDKKTPSPLTPAVVKNGAGDSDAAEFSNKASPVKTPLAKWYDLFERTSPAAKAKGKPIKKSASSSNIRLEESNKESTVSAVTEQREKTKVKPKERPKTCGARTSKQTGVKNKKMSKKMKEAFYDVIDVAAWTEDVRPKHKRGLVEREDCLKIIDLIYNDPRSDLFRSEVKSSEVPDYHKIVKYSMCLDQVASKLRRQIYTNIEQFISDVRRVFWNCRLYHSKHNTKESEEELRLCTDVETVFHEHLGVYFPHREFSHISGSPPHDRRQRTAEEKCPQKATRISRELRSLMG